MSRNAHRGIDDAPLTVAVDSTVFRRALGCFATGLTVVTAASPAGPVGFTCQSFSSLSLDPPLVTIHPGRSSTTWPLIRDTGRFCVNVLAGDQEHLSVAFARGDTDRFAHVGWKPSRCEGTPVLDGVLAWFDCRIVAEYEGGDHTIVVGAVRDFDRAPAAAEPLLFHQGEYLPGTAAAR